MAENYYKGMRRIFYRASSFNDTVTVSVNVVKPDLTNLENFVLTKVDAVVGLYYFDYEFVVGIYVAVFYENGIKSGSQVYDIIEEPAKRNFASGSSLINL